MITVKYNIKAKNLLLNNICNNCKYIAKLLSADSNSLQSKTEFICTVGENIKNNTCSKFEKSGLSIIE